jgi:anti-sigma factor RsiW
MNCKQAQGSLIFRLKDSLPIPQSEAVDRHLLECAACAHLYVKMQTAFDLLQAERKGMSNPFFITRVEQQVISQGKAEAKPSPSFIRLLKPVLLAFLIVAGCFIGWAIGTSGHPDETASVTADPVITQIADQYQLNMSHDDAIENYYVTQ